MTKETKYKKLLHLLVVLCLYGVVQGCEYNREYEIEPISATIVDSVTGEPVEGVVVVSLWQAYDFVKGRAIRVIRADEAVTDKNGNFSFEGSPPAFLEKSEKLNRRSHDLYIYKHGYIHQILGTVEKDVFEKDFGPIKDIPHEQLSFMVSYYPIADHKYEQAGYRRYSIWSGRKIEIVKHDFSKFTDKDYQAVRQGLGTMDNAVQYASPFLGKDRPPGSNKKRKLYKYSGELEKTSRFLGRTSLDIDIEYILKLGDGNG